MVTRLYVPIFITLGLCQPALGQTLGSETDGSAIMNAKQALELMQQRADHAYADGDYSEAYRLYNKLQKIGDHFSEFRLATMYEDGLYVEKDLIQAYAWSFLAAESGRQEYRDYHESIKQRLSEAELLQAREHAGSLALKNGVYANLLANRKLLRKELNQCTGSRLGSRCDRVSMTSFNCSAANVVEPSPDCLRIGSLGLTSVASMPAGIKQIEKALDEYIERYTPGIVELGDFELIDNAKPPDDGAD